ncbi:hypothetical protein D3870_12895 [Noviherbaspirillum cavernae]|uniref:Uncharacterized protein n=1 Tax=Noviherbaspirillum cavernae TaxID=2320862 RepID=A0A418X2W8_9BURK|nr:hypothetical protein [Noviherbaspirillum cavernae]RJG06780.1 hypothetical protein D3870_12895 [Noviherbaspirillum cavernae]
MTILVSVKINDGVVMAADSASSFASGMVYHHSRKIRNIVDGIPVGVMVAGAGGIGNESVDTLLKDLSVRLRGVDTRYRDWTLNRDDYTVEQLAWRVRQFLFEEKAQAYAGQVRSQVRLCGYSAGRPLAEAWDVLLDDTHCPPPVCVQREEDFGPRWAGEAEALDRLVLGLGSRFDELAREQGITAADGQSVRSGFAPALYELLFLEAMPISDAAELARFLVETTIGFVRFSVSRPKTVGAPVEIAAITKHEGFHWLQGGPAPLPAE